VNQHFVVNVFAQDFVILRRNDRAQVFEKEALGNVFLPKM